MDGTQDMENRHWSRLSVSENGLGAIVLQDEIPVFFSPKVLSLSPSGVGLIVPRPLKSGATVCVRLNNRAKTFTCEREAEVVQSRPFENGWVMSLSFAECLRADDVLLLLAAGDQFAVEDKSTDEKRPRVPLERRAPFA
jgi:hypothetical protein